MAVKKEWSAEDFYGIDRLLEYLEDIADTIIYAPTILQDGAKYTVIVYRRVEYYD